MDRVHSLSEISHVLLSSHLLECFALEYEVLANLTVQISLAPGAWNETGHLWYAGLAWLVLVSIGVFIFTFSNEGQAHCSVSCPHFPSLPPKGWRPEIQPGALHCER